MLGKNTVVPKFCNTTNFCSTNLIFECTFTKFQQQRLQPRKCLKKDSLNLAQLKNIENGLNGQSVFGPPMLEWVHYIRLGLDKFLGLKAFCLNNFFHLVLLLFFEQLSRPLNPNWSNSATKHFFIEKQLTKTILFQILSFFLFFKCFFQRCPSCWR